MRASLARVAGDAGCEHSVLPLPGPTPLQFYDSFSGHASMDDVTEAALRALSRVQVRAAAHSLLHAPCVGGSKGSP